MSGHHLKDGEIPGRVGYRTRGGRTGLDPIDTQLETSHMEGVFYRKLFTGRLRTHNPVYLIVMAGLGILFVAFPLVGIMSASSTPNGLSGPDALRNQVLLPIVCLWPFGMAFLFNVIMSLRAHHGDKRA
ncbi:MAG TPA: hypothetical protein VKQ72_22495 [Aggregatilineales bacterium]|nr:hypothetical protein [Aggregatilineales bacterium]